jgi:putative endopeptidase
MGDGVARAYVARAFSPADRAVAVALVERMRGVFRERLATLEWLSPQTRQRAVAKLDSMQFWIGYPDRWNADAELSLSADVGSAVLLAVRRERGQQDIATIDTPVDRARWVEANPAFADLSYYASLNTVLVTAGMLQRPAFDPRADEVTNLANIGFGLGHELSHGFDSYGRFFNELGARQDWWTPEEAREFQRRADLVVAQYSEYPVVDSFRTNGRRSLRENIADINGVALAHETFRRVTAGQPNVTIDGFTREQRFFIALAQAKFRVKSNAVAMRRLIDSEYAADQWRLNGALANLSAFAEAFGCKDGDRMVRPLPLRASIF